MRNTFGGNDLEYTGETQRYTYTVLDENGVAVEKWFGYNSVFYASGDGSCTGEASPGLSITFAENPTDAELQQACSSDFNLPAADDYATVSSYGWMELGSTGWLC
ncbi:hypothetical protein [Dermatobacter hominis]|uniref:hypothetical protein n=1 Tax=Dermatobacter hominis TaxID=2884263 RepID=UPI001D12929E|nr:hypothetical protein [Dermatobacter hominis]UDY36305.1 hypothetical protein LH044_01930 [Dermatobacter hominis]